MSGYGWDNEDDEENDEELEDEDNEDPYGEDDDPYGEDDGYEGDEDEEEEPQDDGEKEEKKKANVKGEGKGDVKGEISGKAKGPNMKKIIAYAKSAGFPATPLPVPCPKCKKTTLFSDKYVPTGIRIAKFIGLSCVGAASMTDAVSIARFVCLNPKCKAYYPKTGSKFMINAGTLKLEEKKNYFYVIR